ADPLAGLILLGNTLYGTTEDGGSAAYKGMVFAIKTDGTGFTNLHSFIGGSDGAGPTAGFISGNTLYGTAGTVFSISFRPQRNITPSGTHVILSWPANVAGF